MCVYNLMTKQCSLADLCLALTNDKKSSSNIFFFIRCSLCVNAVKKKNDNASGNRRIRCQMAARFFIRLLFMIHIGLAIVEAVTYTCSSSATCGCSLNSAVLTKIVGGEQAGTNTWGWAVSIRVRNTHACGGTLLSSTWVLTAAHCLVSITSKDSLSIYAGSQYLSVIDQKRLVSNFYIHSDYNTKTFVNDIAIIQLDSPLDLNDRALAIICLPPSTVTTSEYPTINSTLVAIGWGVLSSGSKSSSNTLQQVSLQAISSTAANCRNSLVDASKQFCAGVRGGGKGKVNRGIYRNMVPPSFSTCIICIY